MAEHATGHAYVGRGCLVTGAASGLGRGCAAAFLAAGARVAMTDARGDAVERAATSLGSQENTRTYEMDVRDAAAVEETFARAWKELGPIDILVNCAGLYPSDELAEMAEDAWDRVLDTNLKGPFLCVRAFARRLVAAGRPGSVANVSSGAARRARLGAAHYCTSKAGLEMLTRCQALELARHDIRVNAVAPGLVPVGSDVNPLSRPYVEAMSRRIPLGRTGQPTDVAAAVLFLCSDRAGWITGTMLSVDGGSSAGDSLLPSSNEQTPYSVISQD